MNLFASSTGTRPVVSAHEDHEIPNDVFKRKEYDLYCTKTISFAEAAIGYFRNH